MEDCELLVIGSGPAGEMAALEGRKCGKSTILVEKEPILGGAAANTGTLPSKTLRETALFLDSFNRRSLFGVEMRMELGPLNAAEFLYRERKVVEAERERIQCRLDEAGVVVVHGCASFVDTHTVAVEAVEGTNRSIRAETIVIATGSRPFVPGMFREGGGEKVFDSSSILKIEQMPDSIAIVGGGVIGSEFASLLACLGVKVTLVNSGDSILSFLDGEIRTRLEASLERIGVKILKNERIGSVECDSAGIVLTTESGKEIAVDCALAATGRSSNTEDLALEKAGIATAKRGLIPVNEHGQTAVPHIYAAGDVIGFPSLASTSIEQGRVAVQHAFVPESERILPGILPFGIYTIPECSMVGETEEQLTARNADYLVGKASYADNARGLIVGEKFGLLKLLFEKDSLKLLGCHILGESATDLIHTAVIALRCEATADLFLSTPFNYPTLSELYKHAARDAVGEPSVE